MKSNLNYSIIIRTRNNKDLLEKILKKIKKQKGLPKPEIVLVDSSSTDGTVEVAKKNKLKIVTMDPKEFSHSNSLNIGADNAKNEILFYVSVDIIPRDEYWAFHIVKHFEDKKIGGVFGRQEPIKDLNPIEEFKVRKIFPKEGKPVALFSCASGAIRKSIWEKIKYDENLPYKLMGGQDQTWVLEAEKLGYNVIYEPRSVVYHSHRYSTKSRFKTAYLNGYYKQEMEEFNKEVKMLKFRKIELIKYLIKKRKYKDLFWNLLTVGILLRVCALKARIDRKLGKKIEN